MLSLQQKDVLVEMAARRVGPHSVKSFDGVKTRSAGTERTYSMTEASARACLKRLALRGYLIRIEGRPVHYRLTNEGWVAAREALAARL